MRQHTYTSQTLNDRNYAVSCTHSNGIIIIIIQIEYDHCDFVSDAVLLGVSEDPLASFTLISPADGVYVADCQASTPLPCPGVHYVERALPIIQDIFTRLQNASCSDLGDINITENFTCSAPTTPTTASPIESAVTPSIEIIASPTSSPTESVKDSGSSKQPVCIIHLL